MLKGEKKVKHSNSMDRKPVSEEDQSYVPNAVLIGYAFERMKKISTQSLELLKWKIVKSDDSSEEESLLRRIKPLKMSDAEIRKATHNFSSELITHRGGFGPVYQGTLSNSVRIAVKRKAPGVEDAFRKFMTELLFLSQISHPRIVPLVGYCDDLGEMILVYQYMEKGNLGNQLYVKDLEGRFTLQSKLSWEQRLQICVDTAEAIHYLHSGIAESIVIHRQVRSSNIWIDENFRAKLTGLGRAKSGPSFYLDEYIKEMADIVGYLDPQYWRTRKLTEKSDVYSFGVVLLEVLCARPALSIWAVQMEETNLAKWGMICLKKGELGKIMDPVLVGTIHPASFKIYCETVENCLRDCRDERPVMREVLWNLEMALEFQLQGKG